MLEQGTGERFLSEVCQILDAFVDRASKNPMCRSESARLELRRFYRNEIKRPPTTHTTHNARICRIYYVDGDIPLLSVE